MSDESSPQAWKLVKGISLSQSLVVFDLISVANF